MNEWNLRNFQKFLALFFPNSFFLFFFFFFFKQTAARGARADDCPGARGAFQQYPRKACVAEKEMKYVQTPR